MNAEPKWTALPVRTDARKENYQEVKSFQASKVRNAKIISWGALIFAGVSLVGNVVQSVAIAEMLPLKQIEPVYLWLQKKGAPVASTSWATVPASAKLGAVNAQLYLYVRYWESYIDNYPIESHRYNVVSEMSDQAVRKQYHQYFLPGNANSPQVAIGSKGQIDTKFISIFYDAPNVARITYRKTVTMYGETPKTTTETSVIRFKHVTDLPANQTIDNPPGIVVTGYQDSGQ